MAPLRAPPRPTYPLASHAAAIPPGPARPAAIAAYRAALEQAQRDKLAGEATAGLLFDLGMCELAAERYTDAAAPQTQRLGDVLLGVGAMPIVAFGSEPGLSTGGLVDLTARSGRLSGGLEGRLTGGQNIEGGGAVRTWRAGFGMSLCGHVEAFSLCGVGGLSRLYAMKDPRIRLIEERNPTSGAIGVRTGVEWALAEWFVWVSLFRDDACSVPLFSTGLDSASGMSACTDIAMQGATLGSMEATWLVNDPGSCTPTGGVAFGEIIPDRPPPKKAG